MQDKKTIYRVRKNTNYTTINNTGLYDPRLSWKAKGLLAHMLTRPDDWAFHNTELVKHAKDGIDSVKSGMAELQNAGYVHREAIRDEKGRVKQWVTIVYETPELAERNKGSGNNSGNKKDPEAGKPLLDETRTVGRFYPEADFPQVENPQVENPQVENPPLLSTDNILSTDRYKNNNHNKKPNPLRYFELEGIGELTETTKEWILEWLDPFYFDEPDEVVQAAMEQAVANNKRSWSYVNRVLRNWYESGIKTLEDVKEREKEWERRWKRKRPIQKLGKENIKKDQPGQPTDTKELQEERKKEFDRLMKKIKQKRVHNI